jgi:thymidylate synthase
MFSLVLCLDKNNGIGMYDGTIPFKNSADMANFKRLTTGNIVIMGRKTWETLKGPLQGRLNIIVSSARFDSIEECPNTMKFKSIEACMIELSKKEYTSKKKYVIGGASLYNYFLLNKLAQRIYCTKVHADFACEVKVNYNFLNDIYISEEPEIMEVENKLKECAADGNIWTYRIYEFLNQEEGYFLSSLREVIECGANRADRTRIGTKAVFGHYFEFNLSGNTIPLGTTKPVPLRLVFEELMWFLRGQTDSKILEAKGVNIWKGNSSREFLDSRGLAYKEGDTGPAYGFAFRHYGADYVGADANYEGKGFDQLEEVIRLIREEPHSRRILINLWNPAALHKTPLPPCLYGYQFFVDTEKKTLSCLMSQRSSDISLAGFWNIATGSLLTILLARITGLKPSCLKWMVGDIHIYNNQIDAVQTQLGRAARCYPKIFFKDTAPSSPGNITDFVYEDIILVGYNPYPAIKSIMNV